MADPNDHDLPDYRTEAEGTRNEPLSTGATRPGRQRAKTLSVRLDPAEFDNELTKFAEVVNLPAPALARGWILDQLRAGTKLPITRVERSPHEVEQLRRQSAP